MRRVIVKEIRITNGNRVMMGYDVHRGRRQWWATDAARGTAVRHQQVIPVDNWREAVALFWDLYQGIADEWFDEHVSMFRPRHEEGPFGGAFRSVADYWFYRDAGLASEAYRV